MLVTTFQLKQNTSALRESGKVTQQLVKTHQIKLLGFDGKQ